jgi:hypothetical protein
MAPSVPFRALLSVITTSNNPDLSGQRLRRIEVPALDGPQAELRQPCGGSPNRLTKERPKTRAQPAPRSASGPQGHARIYPGAAIFCLVSICRVPATLVSPPSNAGPGIRFNEHIEGDGATVFRHACKLGLEGIVSKRKDSRYRSGRSPDWLKMKNPDAQAVKREAEEDWGR